MKYIKKFESKYYPEMDPRMSALLPYKEGDVVDVYCASRCDEDIEGIMEIVFVRQRYYEEDDEVEIIYGVQYLGEDPDYYVEVSEENIIRKLEPHEIAALKYNL